MGGFTCYTSHAASDIDIGAAVGLIYASLGSDGYVVLANGIIHECSAANGVVPNSVRVGIQRLVADSRVEVAVLMTVEGSTSHSCVRADRAVVAAVVEGAITYGCVVAAARVLRERLIAVSRVV